MTCYAPDTVHKQKFELSCNREVNSTTGLISFLLDWTLGPPDLPYDLAEAFQNLTIFVKSTIPLQSVDAFYAYKFGKSEDDFRWSSVPAVYTLQRNMSGSLLISGARPRFSPEQLVFEVKIKLSMLFSKHSELEFLPAHLTGSYANIDTVNSL